MNPYQNMGNVMGIEGYSKSSVVYGVIEMKKLLSIGFVCAFALSCLLAASFSSQTAKADTTVSSDITTDTTWYAVSSPYIISRSIAVNSGVTLTIEPGVTVKFSAGTKLTVAGNLNAVGTSISMINFTSSKSSPVPGDYDTTVFTGGSSSTFIMEYCNVQYATNGVTLASPSGGEYNIQNCEISHNKNSGIYITQQDNKYSFIQFNQISYNPTGIGSNASAILHDINIEENNLHNNTQNGVYLFSSAVSSNRRSYSYLYNINIAENNVSNNGGCGIYCIGQTCGSPPDVTITSNQIGYNLQGIVIEGAPGPGVAPGITANIIKNTICHNTNQGVDFLDYYNDPGNTAHYNNIYSNGEGMNVRVYVEHQGDTISGVVNAIYNWWGDSSGPHNDASNPSGTGNPTNSDNTNLTFIPWLTAPFNTTPPNNSAPNTPSAPTGPTSVYTGASHQYTSTATDPDGDLIKYGWDWNGDGVVDEWSGLVPSGTSDVRSHSWSSPSVYNVSVIVEDQYGAQSGWSGKLQVTVQNAPVPEFTHHVLIATVSAFTAIFLLIRKRRQSGTS